ncbi:DDE-type integrase/transposase/recombinase [Streptomyces sp. NPDC055134]
MRELAAGGIPVTVTCRVLQLARQPYYRWLERPVTDAVLDQAHRANALFDAHRDVPEFGYRFLADEARSAGAGMADRTAWRVCRDNQWWSVFGKERGTTKKADPPVHDDLVCRDVRAEGPNRLWLAAGIIEHATDEGKLCLCAVKDVFSTRIVGYSIDARMKSRLAVAALDNAVARREDIAGCVLHTDRGFQFRSRKFVRALDRHRMAGSIGRVGAAGAESANVQAKAANRIFERDALQLMAQHQDLDSLRCGGAGQQVKPVQERAAKPVDQTYRHETPSVHRSCRGDFRRDRTALARRGRHGISARTGAPSVRRKSCRRVGYPFIFSVMVTGWRTPPRWSCRRGCDACPTVRPSGRS